MAEGRSKALWGHTSSILTILANVNRDPKRTKPYKPSDFDPHARQAAERARPLLTLKEGKPMILKALGLKERTVKPGGK